MGKASGNRRCRCFKLGELASAVSFSAWTGFETGLSAWIVAGWLGLAPAHGLLAAQPVRFAAAAFLALAVPALCWARLVEPYRLGVTELFFDRGGSSAEGRLAFVSDIHADGASRHLAGVAERIAMAKPDSILLGGDYANDVSPRTLDGLSDFIRRLVDIAPVYAVIGNNDELRPRALDALSRAGARILSNESVDLPGGLRLHGVNWLDDVGLRDAAGRFAGARLNVCLTHAPGLVPEADALGFNLYLAGHTHAGQVRMPWWGAIITCDPLGKRFESGRYDLSAMTVYVTRGLGCEGGVLGRMRFLAPPEAVVVRWRA